MSESRMALLIGLIGFVGAVLGAAIGLIGALFTTSRQIDRQERDVRRKIYSSYLACAMSATDLLNDQRRAFVASNQAVQQYNDLLKEARNPANAASETYIRMQVDKQWQEATKAGELLEALSAEFRPVWHALTTSAHELKIHAPDPVFRACMHIYNTVGAGTAFDRPLDNRLEAARSRALVCFSHLARSDSRSPGARPLRVASRQQATELTWLDTECRRLEQGMDESRPEIRLPLLPEDELYA